MPRAGKRTRFHPPSPSHLPSGFLQTHSLWTAQHMITHCVIASSALPFSIHVVSPTEPYVLGAGTWHEANRQVPALLQALDAGERKMDEVQILCVEMSEPRFMERTSIVTETCAGKRQHLREKYPEICG